MARLASLLILMTLIVFLGITFFQVIAPFLLPLFLAGVLAILCQPLFRRWLVWTGNRTSLAAGLTTASVLTLILGPFLLGTILATGQLYSLAQSTLDSSSWKRVVKAIRIELKHGHIVQQVEQAQRETGEKNDSRLLIQNLQTKLEMDELFKRLPGAASQKWDVAELERQMKSAADRKALIEKLEQASGKKISTDEMRDRLQTSVEVDKLLQSVEEDNNHEKVDPEELLRQLQARVMVEGVLDKVSLWTGEKITLDEFQRKAQDRLREVSLTIVQKTLGAAGSTLNILGAIVSMLVSLLTFVIALFYFLADGPALLDAMEKLIPVDVAYQRQLLNQFDQAVRAVVLATFAAALAQGVATGIGVYIAGFSHFFIITVVATLLALVPVLGTWLIWGPCAIWLFWVGDWGKATCLVIYGAVFVGFLDNIVRTYVLNSNVKLHPLLAFVSVLGGLQVMGLWGVFIGPIVASCLHALINIFNTELTAFSQEKQSQSATSSNAATGATVSTVTAALSSLVTPQPAEASPPAADPNTPTPPPASTAAKSLPPQTKKNYPSGKHSKSKR